MIWEVFIAIGMLLMGWPLYFYVVRWNPNRDCEVFRTGEYQ